MKRKELIFTALLAFSLFLSENTVHAEETSIWKFGDYFLYDYQGEGGTVTIPETLMDCPVTGIGIGVFGGNETITSIVFPETVTMLDQSVANICDNLTNVTLPQNLQIIGDGCFAVDPALTEVTIPPNVCYIGEGCFNSCDTLTSVTFKGVCPVFSGDSFLDNPNMVLYVPDDELAAYQDAFSEMEYDTFRIEPSGKNAIPQSPVSDEENLEFDAGTGTITGYLGFSTRLDIPETIDGVPVTAIGEHAFAGDSLSYIYMSGLTPPEIAATTFESSSDFDVDLNEHCTKQQMQEVQAFFDTAGLPCRVWRNQNTQVQYCSDGEYILNPNDSSTAYFAGCASGEANIRAYDSTTKFGEGKDVIGLADEAFKGNQTLRYYDTDLFTYIGKEAFADSSLEQVDLFDSVTTIGDGAFRNCSMLQEIKKAFYYNKLIHMIPTSLLHSEL